MTLRLAHDSKVVELGVGNLMDIPGMARRFAQHAEEGEHGDVERVVVIVDNGGLTILNWGENTSPYELMGMFEAAKLQVFADHLNDD